MSTTSGPAHLLLFDKAFTDNPIDRGFGSLTNDIDVFDEGRQRITLWA
jgi:hypothetical protein